MEFEAQLEKIVNRCQSGERAAFEELFEIYQPRLKYYLRRLDRSSTIDDRLQDTWLTVFKKIHKLKKGQSFGVWLYRIARNKVYDGHRKKDRFVKLPEDDQIPVSGSAEPTYDAKDAVKLHTALNILKPYHREVLTLYFIEQLSYLFNMF